MNKLKENFPKDLTTIRACPYCSFMTESHYTFEQHIDEHTDDQKNLLVSGDIHRLIQLAEKEIYDMYWQLKTNKCCNSDTCLHNYKTSREKRLEIIINKLKKYENKNDSSVVAYNNGDVVKRLKEKIDEYEKDTAYCEKEKDRDGMEYFYTIKLILEGILNGK